MGDATEETEEGEDESEDIVFDNYESDEILPHNLVWKNILHEIKQKHYEIESYEISKHPKKPDIPPNKEVTYLDKEIFPLLLPVLKLTLFAAQELECVTHQKSVFNGIDFISQLLWNLNPNHPERSIENQNIFLMDWTRQWLDDNPRAIFPKSWIWSREEAAIKIQAYMRGHFIRRIYEVQEMREFWKILKAEKAAAADSPEG